MLAPERPGLFGMDIAQPSSLFSRHRDSGGRANVLQGISLATGENRLMALQTLSPPQLRMSEPLVGASSRSLVAINAPWRQDAWVVALFYLLLAHLCHPIFVIPPPFIRPTTPPFRCGGAGGPNRVNGLAIRIAA